jgi:hypothetical protein
VALGAWVLHQPARAAHPLWAAGEALVVMAGVVLLARTTTASPPPPAAVPAQRQHEVTETRELVTTSS